MRSRPPRSRPQHTRFRCLRSHEVAALWRLRAGERAPRGKIQERYDGNTEAKYKMYDIGAHLVLLRRADLFHFRSAAIGIKYCRRLGGYRGTAEDVSTVALTRLNNIKHLRRPYISSTVKRGCALVDTLRCGLLQSEWKTDSDAEGNDSSVYITGKGVEATYHFAPHGMKLRTSDLHTSTPLD